MLSEVFCLNLTDSKSWGFSNEMLIGNGKKIIPNMASIPKEMYVNYSNYDRQNIMVWEIVNRLFDGDDKSDMPDSMPMTSNYWANCVVSIEAGLRDGIVRNPEVIDFLWRRRAKLGIPSISFTYRLRNNEDPLIPDDYAIDGRKLNIAFEELKDTEISKFRFDFLPNSTRAINIH